MFPTLLLFLAALPPITPPDVSSAVVEVVRRHGPDLNEETERALQRLGEAGDRSAFALLGELHGMSIPGREPDWSKWCSYSEMAGEHSGALHNLATCYFLGQGRPRDLNRALELYERASQLGFAKSHCALGNMLISGMAGRQDPAYGLELCRHAADSGEPDAATDYGGYLLLGEHIERDPVEARRYLAAAAERRQPNAAFLLGQIYWNGDGIEQDREEAVRWWIVAHEGGRPDAASAIGLYLAARVFEQQRSGVIDQPLVERAIHWERIAAVQDPDPAKRAQAAQVLELLTRTR